VLKRRVASEASTAAPLVLNGDITCLQQFSNQNSIVVNHPTKQKGWSNSHGTQEQNKSAAIPTPDFNYFLKKTQKKLIITKDTREILRPRT
jgi:hypothetical protein